MRDTTGSIRTPPLPASGAAALYAQRRFPEALRFAEQQIAQQKPDAPLLNLAGACALILGNAAQAERYWQQALSIDPAFAPASFNLGKLYQDQGKGAEAEACYRSALANAPQAPDASPAYPTFLRSPERFDIAKTCYDIDMMLQPSASDIAIHLGVFLRLTRLHFREAEACYRKALAIRPDHVIAYNYLGRLCFELERFDEAEIFGKRAAALMPRYAPAYFDLGNLYSRLARWDDAVACYRKALDLHPRYADAYLNLGVLLLKRGQYQDAEQCYRQVIAIRPDYVDTYNNLGVLYQKLIRFSDAETYHRKALALQPEHPKTRLNLGVCCLMQGRFDEGWPLYEARYRFNPRFDDLPPPLPVLPFPQWRGESLAGKSLLVWPEQGFGDMIQFVRYVVLLKQQGAARITVMCAKPLEALLRTLDGVDRIVRDENKDSLPTHDYWTFPLSIPLYLQTRLETIPSRIGYLSVPEASREKWRNRIPRAGMKVGLVWKGSPDHTGDAERSLPGLETLKPLWDIPGVTFVSLQKGQGEDEAAHPPAAQPVLHLGTDMEDFADAAAILEQLDVLICVDTATAHLAGVLGKPVWILIPFVPDWRWMRDRNDSPWYSNTLRLFRQKERGNWPQVIERVKIELGKAARNTT